MTGDTYALLVRPPWGRPPREQSIAELLPARVAVETEGVALLLMMRGIQERRAVLVLPLPFGRFEVRARDAGWLELEAMRL